MYAFMVSAFSKSPTTRVQRSNGDLDIESDQLEVPPSSASEGVNVVFVSNVVP
jgi:hypothetical protein